MSLTPKRENILDYIVGTSLALIDGTGNYNYDVQTITRNVRQPSDFDFSELPAIMVRDDLPTNYQHMTGEQYETGTNIGDLGDGMMVWLLGVVGLTGDPANADSGIVSQAANQLMTDMIQAMLAGGANLGGNAEAITLRKSENSLQWAAGDDCRAVTSQIYSVNYIFNPQTPTI